MLIGGAINLAANWDNIDNFAQGIGYFTGGAIGGGLSVLGPVGWAIGGSITNSTNAYLGGARGNDLLLAGAVGGVSGLAGGYGSQLASKYVGGIALNGLQVNSNSAIGGAISGAIGGGRQEDLPVGF